MSDILARSSDAVSRFKKSGDSDAVRDMRDIASEALAALEGRPDFTYGIVSNRQYSWLSGKLSVEYFGWGPITGSWMLDNPRLKKLRITVVRNFLRDFPLLVRASTVRE